MKIKIIFFKSVLVLALSTINLNDIFSQELHHQMISLQGNTSFDTNGYTITQTVGQISLIGNSKNIIQGFQQPYWNQLISNSSLVDEIKISHFPNPVINSLQFNFSNYSNGTIKLLVFDFSGRVLIEQNIRILESKSIIDLKKLPTGNFLIYLRNDKINYYTKIIKK
tara:strand:+ start:674 stop:1174 length:501 start_codon:yes stop_codon:yes gene_type:complete